MLVARFALLALVLLIASSPTKAEPESALSYGPIPGFSEDNITPKGQPTRNAENSAPDQRGTEQSPLVVKVIGSDQAQRTAGQDTTQSGDKSSSDLWLLWLTGALVFVGLLQFGAFIFQAIALFRTIKTIRDAEKRQSDDMKAAIDTAETASRAAEISAGAAVKSSRERTGRSANCC